MIINPSDCGCDIVERRGEITGVTSYRVEHCCLHAAAVRMLDVLRKWDKASPAIAGPEHFRLRWEALDETRAILKDIGD